MTTILKKGSLKVPDLPDEVPINYIISFIKNMRASTKKADKVLILLATTGTGKSTVLPPALYNEFGASSNKIIAVTQPKVLNTVTMPGNVTPFNPNLILGQNIGFKTGPRKVVVSRGILFMTIGSLQMQLKVMTDEEICEAFSFIIVDELHETSRESDMLQYDLKQFIKRCHKRPDCPIIIGTSATIDPQKYMDYFETKNFISVEGFSFPIEEHFLEYSAPNFIDAAFDLIEEIMIKTEKKVKAGELDPDKTDIAVFLPGKKEIIDLKKKLEKKLEGEENEITRSGKEKKSRSDVMIFVIDREANQTNSKEVDQGLKVPCSKLKTKQKILLLTNAGETGITPEYTKYLIDTGFYKSQEYNPVQCFSSLVRKPIPLFSYFQRRGRVGRRFSGESYCCYTKETKEALQLSDYPEIYKTDISDIVLRLCAGTSKIKSLTDIMNLDLLHKPSFSSVFRACEKLYLLGFIDSKFRPTTSGTLALSIPRFSIERLKIIFAGFVWKAPVHDLILCAAFDASRFEKKETEFSKVVCCDFLSFVEQWYAARELEFNINKMMEQKLDIKKIIEVNYLRDEALISLAKLGLNPLANSSLAFDVHKDSVEYAKFMKRCLYEGLKLNLASWEGTKFVTRAGLALHKKFAVPVQAFIYGAIELKFEVSKRELKAVGCSVLDGFIIPDNHFD